jgi:hypothetical protein
MEHRPFTRTIDVFCFVPKPVLLGFKPAHQPSIHQASRLAISNVQGQGQYKVQMHFPLLPNQ